ncbi:TM2 domain-containing protein 3-like [Mizuhopecten yessoensis]|uniref:TM2 domain-containing protein 3-like n=1 Tax=Mizuhopecten yessoensis TaxID=6573 RepID=UPI000B45EA7D|nr:TM2 domain-containing protein 3-like [Mizuhopecten yessoensis]
MDLTSFGLNWAVITLLALSGLLCIDTATNENSAGPTPSSPVENGASSQQQLNVTNSVGPSSEDQVSSGNQNEFCPDGVECHKLGAECINCNLNTNCQYGSKETAQCTVKSEIDCTVSFVFAILLPLVYKVKLINR